MLSLFFYFPLLPPGRTFSGLLSAIVPPDKEQRTGLGPPENDDFPQSSLNLLRPTGIKSIAIQVSLIMPILSPEVDR